MKNSVLKTVEIITSQVQTIIEMKITPGTIITTEIVTVATITQEVTPKKTIKFKTKKK